MRFALASHTSGHANVLIRRSSWIGTDKHNWSILRIEETGVWALYKGIKGINENPTQYFPTSIDRLSEDWEVVE